MKKISLVWVVIIQWALGLMWLHSGWTKWTSPEFKENIAQTLGFFASKNPHSFYVSFLQNTAIPNAQLFGSLTRIGEMSVAIALIVSGVLMLKQNRLQNSFLWLTIFALFAAALMNLNFFLAGGWTSPAVWGINLLMAIQAIALAIFYITNRTELSSTTNNTTTNN